jgi:hypothetical protein
LPTPRFDWIFIWLCILLTQAHQFNWISIGLCVLVAQERRRRLSSCVPHTDARQQYLLTLVHKLSSLNLHWITTCIFNSVTLPGRMYLFPSSPLGFICYIGICSPEIFHQTHLLKQIA